MWSALLSPPGSASRIAGGVACALALARALPAQTPDLRDALAPFEAMVGRATDCGQLRRTEQQLGRAEATPEAEATRRVKRGVVRLRLGALGDGWSFGRAVADLRRATELEPTWSDAWLRRGKAEQAVGDWQAADARNLGKRVGFGSLEDAAASFAKAIALDPGNLAAGKALFAVARTLRDTARFAALVLPALRRMAAAGPSDTGLYLALGRTERLIGDPQSGAADFERYLALGGNRGVGLRELAWSRFQSGDSTADSAYYAAAAENDSESVAALRADLALIANDSVLMEFDASAGMDRAASLRRFWADHGHRALRSPTERLTEHYRRITYAERHFGLEVNRRFYGIDGTDMFRSGSDRFDDRGVVYVRYGEPTSRATTRTFGIQPNESWRYARADGDLLLHFAANVGGDIRDYRLVPSVTDIGGVNPAAGDTPATHFAFEDRCGLYSPLCKYFVRGPYGQARVLAEERRVVYASTTWAVSTDGYELHFPHDLVATAAAFAVGQAEDRQLLHVAFQVALQATDPSVHPDGYRVPFRVRVNVFDSGGRSTAWLDTTTTLLQPGGGSTVATVEAVGRVILPVPSGHWRYQVALAQGDSIGRVLPTDSIEVGAFTAGRLAVSDLVLSKGGVGAPWVPAVGDTAFFNPRHSWDRTDTLALYHEIYGLQDGAPYSATLTVRRGNHVALRLEWVGTASDRVTRVTRTLSFAAVKPGEYIVELTVADPDGRVAASRRSLRVN